MGLYFKGASAEQVAVTFAREGRVTNKRALRHMRRTAKLVMEQSIRNSPVDWKGYTALHPPGQELEKSHRLVERYGNGGRLEASVEIGGMVGGVNVDEYAYLIHEHLGWETLGKASIAKQASDPNAKVGPFFLERALRDHEDAFEPLLDELIDGLMGL